MPKLGLTMEEGFLESWLCEPGSQVALGQPICEVATVEGTGPDGRITREDVERVSARR